MTTDSDIDGLFAATRAADARALESGARLVAEASDLGTIYSGSTAIGFTLWNEMVSRMERARTGAQDSEPTRVMPGRKGK